MRLGPRREAGEPISLISALRMKRLLLEALPQDAAFAAYRDA